MARVVAVCTSDKKGQKKQQVDEGSFRENFGITGDAHADAESHRQVSLLALASIEKMIAMGADVGPGAFAENLTVDGMRLYTLPLGTRFAIGESVILELTQIGKECHDRCEIFKQVGTCVMPLEGVFTRVMKGGVVKAGDEVKVV
ncbi:MOSC domain-containing protein [Chloroflexota bacterium]